MNTKKKKVGIDAVTPKGVAVFPRLSKPDTKFNPEGVYSTGLLLSQSDADSVLAIIEQAQVLAIEMAKAESKPGRQIKKADLPGVTDVDDQGEPTGFIRFNFKSKAGYVKDGVTHTLKAPPVFDASGKKMEADFWGGSTIKVSYCAAPYYTAALGAGVSLRINGVQVIALVAGGERSAGSLGFGVEEGYVSEAVETQPDTGEEAAQDGADY